MKAILLIISLMLAGQVSWSQQTFDWNQILGHGSVAKLDSFLDSIELGERGSAFDYYNRTLTTSFNERVIFLEDSYGFDSTRSSWRTNNYMISIIQSMDSIALAEVDVLTSTFDLTKSDSSSLFQFESNRLMNQVEQEFRKTYNVSLNRDELFNTVIRFGLRCGRLLISTEEYNEISEFVEQQQVTELRKFLTSTCLEKQLFGIVGFYELKEEGYKIEAADKALIDAIFSKSGEVIHCSGCIVSRTEVSLFKEKFRF